LITIEQLVCQRPKLTVAIVINLVFHHTVFAQAFAKRIISVLSLLTLTRGWISRLLFSRLMLSLLRCL
jgi:hypothetical protein